MDHRGLPGRLTGASCTSCGAAIPVDRIAVLADRGDLAFVELSCPACNSRTMAVLLSSGPDPAERILDIARHPELDPAAEARLAGRPAVTADDVVAMRRFLAAWEGDVRSLLERPGGRTDTGAAR